MYIYLYIYNYYPFFLEWHRGAAGPSLYKLILAIKNVHQNHLHQWTHEGWANLKRFPFHLPKPMGSMYVYLPTFTYYKNKPNVASAIYTIHGWYGK